MCIDLACDEVTMNCVIIAATTLYAQCNLSAFSFDFGEKYDEQYFFEKLDTNLIRWQLLGSLRPSEMHCIIHMD